MRRFLVTSSSKINAALELGRDPRIFRCKATTGRVRVEQRGERAERVLFVGLLSAPEAALKVDRIIWHQTSFKMPLTEQC